MLAVDTNVVVQFFTKDDPQQARRAGVLLDEQEVWLAKTVILETEWVLRKIYRLPAQRIIAGMLALIGLPNVQVEDQAGVVKALTWSSQGMDFADALHLASCGKATGFATFDERLAELARKVTHVNMIEV